MTDRKTNPAADHPVDLGAFVAGANIDAAVATLRPDYRALLIAVDGLDPHANRAGSEALLVRAEETARDLLAETRVEELPHVAAWRDAYRAFGAKPQRTRNSLEALARRADPAGSGLPRVNALADLYNAVSVIHQVPVGGEDLAAYVGSPRLICAVGDEPFDTTANGETVVEHPDAGEVVWCDDVGVTCRRWNWRQGRRTQLTDETTSALFILDALEPMSDGALAAAGDELVTHLRQLGDDVGVATRLVTTSTPAQEHP
jgi:DNA/RNA-binding domain of Phe-tRNA-synthetase-like protein